MPRTNADDSRNASRALTRLALAAAAASALVPLTGCYTSSKTALGNNQSRVINGQFMVADSLGAAMFGETVALAALEARERRLGNAPDYATVNVPVD